jgi:starch-binding outer membrane protein, SusD/RagB family
MDNWNFHIRKRSCVIAMLAVFVVCAGSCRRFVDISPPTDQAVSDIIFSDDNMASSVVTGIYSEMMNSSGQFSSGGVTLFAGMYADELYYYTPGPRDEFVRNQITEASHNVLLSNFWERMYKYIYTSNLILERLNISDKLSPTTRSQLSGECKFIRAFCYFHLVNLFGDVPLALASDYEINSTLPRAKVDVVYHQIITDLESSKQLLVDEYPSAGRVRPNRWAASAMLARVQLYRGEWNKAVEESAKVIDSGLYQLLTALDEVFLRSSGEAIWQLLPVNSFINSTWEGNQILPASPFSAPTYILTDTLLNSFGASDMRKSTWIASREYAGNTVHYPSKYKINSAATTTEYYMVLRLAEQFLIRAEGNARLGNLTAAVSDLNRIRNRAGLDNSNAVTQQEILDAIELERKIELFAEWGHRWYDLKRTSRANEVLASLKPTTWQSTDLLWPIPSSQIRVNPALTQNPGY